MVTNQTACLTLGLRSVIKYLRVQEGQSMRNWTENHALIKMIFIMGYKGIISGKLESKTVFEMETITFQWIKCSEHSSQKRWWWKKNNYWFPWKFHPIYWMTVEFWFNKCSIYRSKFFIFTNFRITWLTSESLYLEVKRDLNKLTDFI